MMTTTKPVALVTGAATGIDRAVALALVDAGYEVVGTSRHTSAVTPYKDVTVLDLDVASDESVTTAVGRVIQRFGRIDVLVNNAGADSPGSVAGPIG
jgi:NAD(P)-dependent dehydrogenase (short-subunit alcohol dehydrogenase family)